MSGPGWSSSRLSLPFLRESERAFLGVSQVIWFTKGWFPLFHKYGWAWWQKTGIPGTSGVEAGDSVVLRHPCLRVCLGCMKHSLETEMCDFSSVWKCRLIIPAL